MAAVNPNGNQQYWIDGLPILFIARPASLPTGNQNYWIDGLPVLFIMPSGNTGNFFLLF